MNTAQQPTADSLLSPGSQNPASKKLRGLQKKIRAIEDLEMRLAGGEKLEDTIMRKTLLVFLKLAQMHVTILVLYA